MPRMNGTNSLRRRDMRETATTLEQLLRAHPEQQERLRPFVDRAKRYSNECGCSMGGAFLAAALVGVLMYDIWNSLPSGLHLVIAIVEQSAFLLMAGALGKLAGIGLARIRLWLMYRDLAARYLVGGG
jgi:VIT1/CCC1 family predicted Fe2+/Mn2+ transporter